MYFKAGDIVFTRGNAWWSKLIRWGTQNTGEAPSRTNHTGVGFDQRYFIEALTKVVKTPWATFFKEHESGTYEIWRNENLTDEQRKAIAEKAEEYLGRLYGFSKIFLQGADCVLGKVFARDVYLFRRVACIDDFPICSWVVAYSYDRGIGYRFGVDPNAADPDEIYDHVANTPGWQRIA